MIPDPAYRDATRRALYRASGGVMVEIRRSARGGQGAVATVRAIVRNVTADRAAASATGYGANRPGGLSQDDRQIIVMADDLAAQNFPLPLQKGDIVLVKDTGDRLTLTRIDSTRRALAGAIEATGTGV